MIGQIVYTGRGLGLIAECVLLGIPAVVILSKRSGFIDSLYKAGLFLILQISVYAVFLADRTVTGIHMSKGDLIFIVGFDVMAGALGFLLRRYDRRRVLGAAGLLVIILLFGSLYVYNRESGIGSTDIKMVLADTDLIYTDKNTLGVVQRMGMDAGIYDMVSISEFGVESASGQTIDEVIEPEDKDKYSSYLTSEYESQYNGKIRDYLFGTPVSMETSGKWILYTYDYDINTVKTNGLYDMVLCTLEMRLGEGSEIYGGSIHIPAGSLIFGPYKPIEPGEYKVSVIGEELDRAVCEVYSNSAEDADIDYEEISHQKERVDLNVSIGDYIEDIEFPVHNTGDKEMTVKRIVIVPSDK
ncbi:MAG: hypothetical protein J6N76_01150 [Lachnospiraceae bacterium]|nr:hypothetical protein [Lachnospiraceae bacterium]